MEKIFEKMGIFYLGRDVDDTTLEPTPYPTLLKSKYLTTHAAIIGMTGSGKTGLGIDLLEEAAIDNIPVIVIDPKGDMGNLCLAFEDLSPEAFLPWVEDEARQKGVDPAEYAQKRAAQWREGIKSFDQDVDRIARFKSHDATIYTPGSASGIPVNVLGSLDAPDASILEDSDTLASAIHSTVASLLALVGIDADPLESVEFILIAQIVKRAWMEGSPLDLGTLISQIINPPFQKIGVLPIESFYPPEKRFKLASRFNNVLASPTFENWLKGEPLDIDALMYGPDQKSKISIFSIAHLSDGERMFFVTLLLNHILGWMRRQSGTERLRALVYMDEIYGYFPPNANPPSKTPMMLMLKQARAFGVGMVLSTQNPVDLDYKGLSNIGTWFIGRLQTRQDIAKVIDGLSGKVAGTLDKGKVAEIIAHLPKRTFFLKSAHIDNVKLFTTRWVLSYLKGPLKAREIARLMARKKEGSAPSEAAPSTAPVRKAARKGTSHRQLPILASAIVQRFDTPMHPGGLYRPHLAFKGSVRFFNASKGIDIEEPFCSLYPLSPESPAVPWDDAQPCDMDFMRAPSTPGSDAEFAPLPPAILSAKSLSAFKKGLSDWLYANRRLELYRCRPLKAESKPGESLEAFRGRLMEILEGKREAESEKLQSRYAKKLETLQSRYRRALERVEKEREDVSQKTTSSVIDAGLAIFGALFGGKRSAASKAAQAIKGGRGVMKEKSDVERAEAAAEEIESKIEDLKNELEEKLDALSEKYDITNYPVETFFVKPRRSDVTVSEAALYWVWVPSL